MLFLYIQEIKIDMVLIPYPYIKPLDSFDGIRLVAIEDIAAMKLSAIARRGVKKDFWDIAELLDYHNIGEMIAWYKQKYSSRDIFHLLRALVYFTDAESQKDPQPLKAITWKEVKAKIERAVRSYLEKEI
ncbi:MAG: nucleotidyl transferase AbiEii/AbiGii toxin family protein [Saprospiraceae bacterium]|nr:nucleotidyl transferase AbiEii/AbiGii toxin family protein [Saprospiraceae bacterium]